MRATIRADYLAGCDGGRSTVRKALGIALQGDGGLARKNQVFFRSEDLYSAIPFEKGRMFFFANADESILVVQDDLKHFSFHTSCWGDEAEIRKTMDASIALPIKYEILAATGWTLHLLCAEHFMDRRVFLAGDSAHLVIPAGGLGLNTGIAEAVAHTRRDGRRALVVDKLRRELIVYAHGRPTATYPVELGVGGLAPKRHAGDRATPEGRYRVVERKERGATRYYKALLLDYPNGDDRSRFERARRRGEIPPGVGAGGLIEIHGHGGRGRDWTDGCVALENPLMDRIYALALVGTLVVIVGTHPGRDRRRGG